MTIALRLINMEKEDRIAMLYAMLATADTQVRVYKLMTEELEAECLKLKHRVNELESQIFGGKVQ